MKNTNTTNLFIQSLQSPKTTLKKYGSLQTGLNHLQHSTVTHRKISQFISNTIKPQSPIQNPNPTQQNNHQQQPIIIQQHNLFYKSIIQNKQIPQNLINSYLTPKNKENYQKSKWQTKYYHSNNNNQPNNNFKNYQNNNDKSPSKILQASHVFYPKKNQYFENQNKNYNQHHLTSSHFYPKANRSISPINPSEHNSQKLPTKSPTKISPKKFIPNNSHSPNFKNQKSPKYSYKSTYQTTPNKILTQSMGSKSYQNNHKSNQNQISIIKSAKQRFSLTQSTFRNNNFPFNFNLQPKLNDFIIGECKGQGRFGKVFLVIHKKTGFICAMKKIKKDSVKLILDQFIQQVKIQQYLNHPKLVKTYGYFSDPQYFYLLIEYMEQGNLYSLLKKHKKLNETQVSQKIQEICQGVKQMHNENIVHRDLKPQNIVISNVIKTLIQGVCKICDFGWAAFCQGRRQTYCGTLDYVCPEIIQGQTYDSSVDIWCIGIMAYQMLCGKAPFYDISRKKTIQKIKSCKMQNFPSHVSKSAINFIQMILQRNPDQRVGINQLLDSQFLKNVKK